VLGHTGEPDPNHEVYMARASANNTTFLPPRNCELSLRLCLRRYGMRLQRRGCGYRLLYGESVLLAAGPDGYGLTLGEIEGFIAWALRGGHSDAAR
jgi:hypothetical protein